MPLTPDPTIDLSDEAIVRRRSAKNPVRLDRPYAFLHEREYIAPGRVEDVATIFITNRECPFRCLMCDLWKNTIDARTPTGAVPDQIRWALDRLPPARHIKLYNSGNFFDPNAIPTEDYESIAELVAPFETVIVESHPLVLGRRCRQFQEMMSGRLSIAMGLETAHPPTLKRLNKRMTLDDFSRAAEFLCQRNISIRTFILVRPPFMTEQEGLHWAMRSLDFAFDVGVECGALIPTRVGNGMMEDLALAGHFSPPSLDSLESALDYGVETGRGRVFVDLWDIENLASCHNCAVARVERLRQINLAQEKVPRIDCSDCAQSQ